MEERKKKDVILDVHGMDSGSGGGSMG